MVKAVDPATSFLPLGIMLLITTALMLEAKPVKSLLGLTALPGMPFPVFSGNSETLVVTGSGAQRAAAATGWALGHFDGVRHAVNIGFAAAGPGVELHSWHLINAVRDESSGRLHVPDLLWDFNLPEAALATVGKPLQHDIGRAGLVDMEASGFFEAARHFLSPDRIVVLKWVSDHFSGQLDPQSTGGAFADSISQIIPVLKHLSDRSIAVPMEPSRELEVVLGRIRLTETQTQYLRRWLQGFLKRGGDFQLLLSHLPPVAPSTKAGNKRLFEEVGNVLRG